MREMAAPAANWEQSLPRRPAQSPYKANIFSSMLQRSACIASKDTEIVGSKEIETLFGAILGVGQN